MVAIIRCGWSGLVLLRYHGLPANGRYNTQYGKPGKLAKFMR